MEKKANLRKIVIEPVTRVEGHGKVTILLDEENKVRQARLGLLQIDGAGLDVNRHVDERQFGVRQEKHLGPSNRHLNGFGVIDTVRVAGKGQGIFPPDRGRIARNPRDTGRSRAHQSKEPTAMSNPGGWAKQCHAECGGSTPFCHGTPGGIL
jgi:hypothetical protein